MAHEESVSRLAEIIARSTELQRDARKTGLMFLRTELATGLTFAKAAQDADAGSDKRIRNRANARKAYDTIMHWCSRDSGPHFERQELEPGLTDLRKALEELGEAV